MKLNPQASVAIPAMMVPSFRTSLAIERGVERNILLKTWGGLGDQICAEPTLRFALKTFKDCTISLASEQPNLFQHLRFEQIFNLKTEQPVWDQYLTFDTIQPPSHLQWEFMSHMLVNCVDYPALCAFRSQLPISDREIFLKPSRTMQLGDDLLNRVFIHAGKHWQSKTFPKTWWDAVLAELISNAIVPVLIGADTDDNRSTVDVETKGCLDLRNKLSINESIYLLQRASVLLTNDSSPLHMAASRDPDDPTTGHAWIGYIATCKHPDYITHWRHGAWNYREVNHGLGGIWDILSYCPNVEQEISGENVGDILQTWLPDPVEYARWAVAKAKDF